MDPADFYTGIVVDVYARLKGSSFDAEPYAAFVTDHGQPGLEIGCGDGEPLLDLVAAGLDVEGVDSSGDMVQRCRVNAAARGLTVAVHHQRVEDLALERRFASIYFAGPTFTLLPDDDTALRALRALRQHLLVGGVALVPLWVPEPTPDDELGVSRTSVEADGTELRYTPVSELHDSASRTRTTSSRYERVVAGVVASADRQWLVHWHTPSSFGALCAEAGLDVVELVDDDTGHPAAEGSTSFTATLCRA